MRKEFHAMAKFTELYLSKAQEPHKSRCEKILRECGDDWAKLQTAFLDIIDEYLAVEIAKDEGENIHTHEAGGQFRIAIPHMFVRRNEKTLEYMEGLLNARRKWTDENLFHGYVDCDEVHHEIETYIYFQQPLYYLGFPGEKLAAENIVDVAHHTGNWEKGVPPWYDWEKHSFVSNWLGTKAVRAYPPYDYQEGNHFRFIDCAICAFHITGDEKYLALIRDYCDLWCDHIERLAAKGEIIACSILPESAQVLERSKAGKNLEEGSIYEIFYSLASDNTMYDIAGGLMDAYSITRNERYLKAAELMIDQFVENGENGRPALMNKEGKWLTVGGSGFSDISGREICDCTYIARLALRHHQMTGSEKYRDIIISWANSIDEENNVYDQMMANVLVAAHYFDGDPKWLARAYEMALRLWANAEHIDDFHQCAWSAKRQGTKFLMEMLYQPILGDVEWGTRGNIPATLLRHKTSGQETLPYGISFRCHMLSPTEYCFEAANSSCRKAEWAIESADKKRQVRLSCGESIAVGPGERITGTITIG
jgi:hypothetical protein